MKEKKLETMEMKSKKKKTFIIVGIIILFVVILFVSIVSSLLEVKESKIYKAKQAQQYQKKELKVIQQPEFKENWAIAVENKIEEQNKKIEEMNKRFQQNQIKIFQEIKDIVREGAKSNQEKIESLRTSLQKEISSFKKEINRKIESQNEKIESLSILVDTLKNAKTVGGIGGIGEKEIVIGPNLLPEETGEKPKMKVEEEKNATEEKKETPEEIANRILKELEKKRAEKEEKAEKKERAEASEFAMIEIDTGFNQKILEEQAKIEKEESKVKEKEEKPSAHVTIGFTQAYLVTGVHAPVFSEGSEEPLPVLLEAEGKIVMANDVEGNIGRCFLIGSAKGEMNSQTAKIRLERISCLLSGGEYRLEGSIRGWVIDGKSGMPGLHGELIHKNGAWMARTFVAGFLETFSEAITTNNVESISFGNGATTGIGGTNEGSTKAAIGSNAATAAGSGISAVFKKIGDYYLKMAEQIFPVIEVRGGRTVDILLLGGEDFSVIKNTPIDVNYLEEKIKEEEARKLNSLNKKDNIIKTNPFTRAVMGESETKSAEETASEDEQENKEEKAEEALPEEKIMKIKIPE